MVKKEKSFEWKRTQRSLMESVIVISEVSFPWKVTTSSLVNINMVRKRPKVEGSKQLGVKCSEVM